MTKPGSGVRDVPHRVALLEGKPVGSFLKVEKAGAAFLTIEHWPGSIDFPSQGKLSLSDEQVRWLIEVLPGVLG